jgi:hypothetical protein
MPKDVGTDFLAGQGRAGVCCCGGVDRETPLDRVTGQVPAVAGGEQGRFRFRRDFGEPSAQVADERWSERGDPLLAALMATLG